MSVASRRSTARGTERCRYVPALRFDVLTPLYDPVVATTTREATVKARLLDRAELRSGHRVLDVGCGTGTLALLAHQREPGAQIVGVDGDPAVLARARRKSSDVSNAGFDVRTAVVFEQAYADALPLADRSVDRVLSSLVFHHLDLETKRRAFAEIARVLDARGRVHIADWGRPHNLAMRAASLPLRLFDGVATTRDNIAGRLPELLRDAGLVRVEVTDRFATAFGTMTLYRAEAP